MAGLRSGDGYSPDTIPSRNTPKRGGNRPWSVSYPWNDAEIFDENCDYENHSIEKSHPSKENIRRIEKPRVRNRSTSHTMVPERSNLNHITTHQRIRSKSPALEENHRNGNVEPMDARAPVTVTPMQDSFSSPHRQDPVEQLTPGTAVSPGEVFYTPMTHLRPADERNMSLPAASLSPTVTPARPRFSLINEKVLTVGSHTSGSIKENTEAHLAVYDEVSRRLDFTLQQARETLSKSMRSSAFDVDRSVFGGTKEEHGTQTSSCGPDAQAPAVDKETNIPTPREEKEQQPNLRDPMKALLQRNSDATMERINNILCRKTIENDRDNAECSTDIPLPKALGACMSAELSSAEKIWRARLQLSKTRHLAKKYNERLEQAQTRAINELRTYQRMQKRLVEVQLRVIMLRKKLPEVPFTGRSVSIRLESKAEERPAKAQNRGVPEAQTRGPTANGDATDLSARSMRRILDARREHVEVMNRRLEEEEKCIEKMTKESIAAQIAKHDKVIVEQNDLMNQLKRLSIGEQYDLEEPPPRTPTPRRDGVAPLDLSLLSNDSPQEESKHPSELIDEPAVAVQVEHAALEMVPEDVALNRTRSQSTVYEDSLSHFSDENDRPPSDDTLYQSDEAPDAGDVTQNASPQPSRRTLDTAETLAMLSRSIVGVAVTETPRMEAVQELESIVNEASAENKAQLEKTAQAKVEPPHLPSSSNVSRELESIDQKIAQEETPVEGRPLISSPVAPPEVDLTPAAELQPQGVPELSRNVSDDKEDVKKEMEVLQSPQARTAEPAKDGNFDEYVEDDWLSSDNDESPNEATATGPAPPPKNFSRLRLFFGSPDEPTKDNVDAEEPEDESTNDQFDSRMEPTSAIGDEETKADENDEAEATSGDELVPRITLRKFVYKEPVIGEVYKEDTDLQPTQWETTPPDTPPVEPLGGAHVVQEEAVREEIVFDRSAWVPEGNALQKRQAKETSEKPDDTHKNVAAEEKMAGDQKGPEIDLSKEPASAPGDGDSTAQIIPSGPVSAPQAELSTSMICLEKAPVELPPTQDPAALAALGAGDSTAQIMPSGPVSGVQDEPRTSRMSPIRTPVAELPPSQDADESPFLARISDMGLNRSDLCDSLSASMMQILESPRRTSVSQSPRYRYALSDSLLEDSTLDVSAGTPKSPKERFTTKLPRTGMSPEYRSFLNESAENSLLDYIVKSETNAALINEKVEKIEEEIAERLGEVTPNAALEVQATTLVEPLDESYEDLMSVKEPPSLLHRLHSPSEPSANAVAKYAADTPRKQATRELSPEALKQDRLEKLRERLESVELKTKTCEQLAEKAWNLIQSQGFMLLSYDSFVPVPESADDIIVDSEDERMLLENHRMTIWTAITEFSAMLWPEHSVRVGLVSTKWLPKPKTAEEFREMAVKYVIEQTSGTLRYSTLVLVFCA
ncbi:unnamed protein product [Nippostrongylus brasiliensis]|uniref:Centrosomal protein of 131 kDa n=1 Tax=Nippostrongylus brasiliensis TaxID=27835 RepID=A0A158R260_NIPBR|nr:unnamed protein product [Nippostrongylus brasiliensis]